MVVKHGCGKRDQMAKLEGVQYRFLRSIARKTWKDKVSYAHLISTLAKYNENFDWANETNKGVALIAIETYCRLARLRYVGHVERMPDDRIPKMIMHGEISLGQRNPGRPLKSFKQSIKDDLVCFNIWEKYQGTGQSPKTLTEDREKWRKLINKQAQMFQQSWQRKRNEQIQARHQKNPQIT